MWDNGEPNDYLGKEDCAGMRPEKDDRWNDIPCSTRNPYICKTSTGAYNVVLFTQRKEAVQRILMCEMSIQVMGNIEPYMKSVKKFVW